MERFEQPQSFVDLAIVKGRENAQKLQEEEVDPIIIKHTSGETIVLTKQTELIKRMDASNKWLSGVNSPDDYGYLETSFTISPEEVVKILNTPVTIH